MITQEDMNIFFYEFVFELYNINIPRSTIHKIINKVDDLFEKNTTFIQEIIEREIGDHCPENIKGSIHVQLQENKNPLKPYLTEYLRVKKCKESGFFIEPEEFELGKESTFQIVNNEEIAVVEETRYGVYIPLEPHLKFLFEAPGMYELIKQYVNELSSDNEMISNVLQGELWKTEYANKNRFTLPLFLFADDFETGNALGSHSDEQKLMGVYISLPFLPPQFVKNMDNIFLVTLFHSKYRKLFGNMAVFKKIIDELNLLSEKGLQIKVNNEEVTIYFQLMLVTGDNEGLNSISGFVESFKAYRYCRMCTEISKNCEIASSIDYSLLRNEMNYKIHVESKNISTGIKEECCFHKVKNFHITKHKTNDAMHDLNEGIIHYTLSNILTAFIVKEKYFSLETLNDRIKSFNYGPFESNKPRTFNWDVKKKKALDGIGKKKIKFKQSASESLCLARYLGLIIGDLIPKHDSYWKLYLTLRQIIDIVTSPRFAIPDPYLLQVLLRNHNEMYLKLFGPLKPKMHLWLHYVESMIKNGPLIHFWGMPYERKNKELKDFIKNCKNHMNVPLTIAIRNQLKMFNVNKRRTSEIQRINEGSIQNEVDSEIGKYVPHLLSAKSYKYIVIDKKKYSPGMVLFTTINSEGPVFRKIEKIYEIHNCFYFVLSEVKTHKFNDHYHAYEVDLTEQIVEITDCLKIPFICECTLVKKNYNYYISMRHQI